MGRHSFVGFQLSGRSFVGFQLSGRGGRFLTPEEQVKNPVSDLEGTRKEHLLLAQKNG